MRPLTDIYKHCKTFDVPPAQASVLSKTVDVAVSHCDENNMLASSRSDLMMKFALGLAAECEDRCARAVLQLVNEAAGSESRAHETYHWISFLGALSEKIASVEPYIDRHLPLTTRWLFAQACKWLSQSAGYQREALVIIKQLFEKSGQPGSDYQNIFQKEAQRLGKKEVNDLRSHATIDKNAAFLTLLSRLEAKQPVSFETRPSV